MNVNTANNTGERTQSVLWLNCGRAGVQGYATAEGEQASGKGAPI